MASCSSWTRSFLTRICSLVYPCPTPTESVLVVVPCAALSTLSKIPVDSPVLNGYSYTLGSTGN